MAGYTFEELDKLSIADLKIFKEKMTARLAEVREGKRQVIGDILALQEMINTESERSGFDRKNPVEGFYRLYSPEEEEPTLVHGYFCSDLGGKFFFGMNTYDGGHGVELSDLLDTSKVVPVRIVEV